MASRSSPATRRTTAPRGPRGGWRVYLLRCADGSLYAGATNDLDRRLARHAAGRGARYTRSRLPIALAWSEPARDRSAALRREAALKRLSRKEKLALVAAYDGRGGRGGPTSPSPRPARRRRAPAASPRLGPRAR